jgi:hypothetical protein
MAKTSSRSCSKTKPAPQGKESTPQISDSATDMSSTYNHYYSDTIQKRRQDKYKEFMMKARKTATKEHHFQGQGPTSSFDQEVFQEEITKSVERDMETFAAEEALESQRAIYKVPFPSSIHDSHIMID